MGFRGKIGGEVNLDVDLTVDAGFTLPATLTPSKLFFFSFWLVVGSHGRFGPALVVVVTVRMVLATTTTTAVTTATAPVMTMGRKGSFDFHKQGRQGQTQAETTTTR